MHCPQNFRHLPDVTNLIRQRASDGELSFAPRPCWSTKVEEGDILGVIFPGLSAWLILGGMD
jgi:hypothetical protein